MELEVGMYVRTEDGYIDKLLKIDSCLGILQSWHLEKMNTCYSNDDFTKASYNLIDLVKVGDFVNNHEVLRIDETYSDATYKNKYKYLWINFGKDVIKNEDIKSIVTREQIESTSYKVGGKYD